MSLNPFTWFRRTDDEGESDEDDDHFHIWAENKVDEESAMIPIWDNRDYAASPRIEDGHLVIPFAQAHIASCTGCDAQHRVHPHSGSIAVPIAFELEKGMSVGDAMYESIPESADYVVSEDGEIETVDDVDDEQGRVIVNASEQERDEAGDGGPVRVGGTFD